MRELVVKYKAEKVCYEEMVKIPLVSLKVLEERHRLRRPMSFGTYEDERVVGIIARAARSKTKSKEEHESHLKMNLELLKKEKCHVKPNKSERTFRTLENMFKACVRNLVVVGILTFHEAEIGESKMIRLELEQETTKKYLADTNLHVHLEEIKVDKTLCFVEKPVEIIDREVKSLKHSRILIVKSIGTRSEVMRIS
nr:putative reverse transcriptase domain-containing protein [Tanacetum cinerariifolium]